MWGKLFGAYGLEQLFRRADRGFVISDWLEMEDALSGTQGLFTSENYHFLKFEDLVSDSETTAGQVFEFLNPGGFSSVRSGLGCFLKSRRGYAPNRHRLGPRQQELVATKWGPIFDKYGYSAGNQVNK